MEDKYRQIYALTDEEIEKLDVDELARIAGGLDFMATNNVNCPICKQKIPIRQIKEHLKTVHGK